MTTLSIALAQLNPIVGDIAGNADKIRHARAEAAEFGADLVICPELALLGYPPEDLILMPDFRRRAMEMVKTLAAETENGPALLIGSVWEEGENIYNAALLLDEGKIVHIQYKTMLPNYGVFDEKRVFAPGSGTHLARWRGHRLGILVCEDMWSKGFDARLKELGAELVIVINASPFEAGKMAHRKQIAAYAASQAQAPLIYVNLVGGQDDLVFDGGSFVLSPDGKMQFQMRQFEEDISLVQWDGASWKSHAESHILPGSEQTLWEAMKLALHDYVHKNGFKTVMLGLSGGIDSAITAALAADALGTDHVKGVLLPSPYTSRESVEDAQETAKLLGIETMTIPITSNMQVAEEVLSPVFKEAGWMENIALGGNLQARLRGTMLMSVSNKFGWMLLCTSNKSEISVGYSTLYGDSCGSYNVLKDLYKTQIYQLSKWRNTEGEVIPKRSISKAPTAELAPGQKDEDQLPPYDVLDKILQSHIEGRLSAEELIRQGLPKAAVEKVVKLVRMAEYKRRQSCPGVKLSPMLFGKDRRFPLTTKF